MSIFQNPFFRSDNKRVEETYARGVQRLQERRFKDASTDFVSAAESGHVSAMYNLAVLYGAGYISPYDIDVAADFFYKAAKAGHPTASQMLPLLEGADKGSFGTENLAAFAAATPSQEGLSHLTMMCGARFYKTLCQQYGAFSDVIAYELDAASQSDEDYVLDFVKRTGVDKSVFASGLDGLVEGTAADQITDGLNSLQLALMQSGMSVDLCRMVRCTIVGYIILHSPFRGRSQQLLGLDRFFG